MLGWQMCAAVWLIPVCVIAIMQLASEAEEAARAQMVEFVVSMEQQRQRGD